MAGESTEVREDPLEAYVRTQLQRALGNYVDRINQGQADADVTASILKICEALMKGKDTLWGAMENRMGELEKEVKNLRAQFSLSKIGQKG